MTTTCIPIKNVTDTAAATRFPLDQWYVASMDAVIAAGACWEGTPAAGNNPAGQPWNTFNDVGC